MSSRWRSWLKRFFYTIVISMPLGVGALIFLVNSGATQRWVRRELISQIELRTGARVELGGFHLHVWHLDAELHELTLHGLEPPGVAPLFYAKRVDVRLRILSFFERKVVLEELLAEKPELALRLDKNGVSNIPTPKIAPSNRPWQETLFDLQIGRLELNDGSAYINDRHVPFTLVGQNFNFDLRYVISPPNIDSYVGKLQWEQVSFQAEHDLPFRFDVLAKFTIHRDGFELDQAICKLAHSELDLRAEVPTFARPDWNLFYRGRLNLGDVRTILRQPETPDGVADFSGQAHYIGENWTASGNFRGRDVAMHDPWFHATAMESWGDYQVANERLTVPNLEIRALGGTVSGKMEFGFRALEFRSETRLRGVSLGAAFAAVNNPEFPVNTLHWDSIMSVDSVNTWSQNFQHFRTTGLSQWTPPDTSTPGIIPVSARIDFDYFADRHGAQFSNSEIHTPKSSIEMDGPLSGVDSAIELKLRILDLTEWDDFINDLRGAETAPNRFAGEMSWRGRILGPIAGPTFSGHLHAEKAYYDQIEWDEIDGALEYSPDFFRLTNTTVRRGDALALMNVSLQFDGDWSFLPTSPWSLDAKLERAPTADIQSMFGTTYPAKGFLSGVFQGSGTRASPALDAKFTLDDLVTKQAQFDRVSGSLHLTQDEWHLSRVEIKKGTGRVAGDFLYRPLEQEAEYHASGTGIPLSEIEALQVENMPLTGKLSFDVRASGPIRAPNAQGEFKLAGVTVGNDAQGDLHGQILSDGKTAHLTLGSDMPRGKLAGEVRVEWTGEERIEGRLMAQQVDMNTFIMAGLHLKQLTGKSSVDGDFTISGSLRQPNTIDVTANISRINFEYQFVNLENDGPVQLVYRHNEVRIERAHLRGPNTDLQFNGGARFDGNRPIHFILSGSINMRFIKGTVPDLEAQGESAINVAIEGTISQPRITGRASLKEAAVNYADFPIGLSHVNGEIVFDRSRLLFEGVTAQSGGGQLILDGSIAYGEGPLRYQINATTAQVRIRYPAGVSWLAGGKLQLAGTEAGSVLSGQIEVRRMLLAEGVDFSSMFSNASETSAGSSTSSPFLRNLTFDIGGHTGPGARIEWSGAHIEIDGDVRLRGTWDRPILLGHVHLLGGEMAFRGNKFQLTRGDINFANPFQIDPELNVEATSLISQYQVTINFSGKASKLSLNYRSDPPLPDSDIIALLALGSPGEVSALRSGTASSQNYGATALLSEAISSGLGGQIERLFGISHFRVDPFLAGTATESNAAARVTIQQQVTPNLIVTYSSNTSAAQYQLIQVEYAVRKDMSIVFLRDINATYGLDIKFVKHLK